MKSDTFWLQRNKNHSQGLQYATIFHYYFFKNVSPLPNVTWKTCMICILTKTSEWFYMNHITLFMSKFYLSCWCIPSSFNYFCKISPGYTVSGQTFERIIHSCSLGNEKCQISQQWGPVQACHRGSKVTISCGDLNDIFCFFFWK